MANGKQETATTAAAPAMIPRANVREDDKKKRKEEAEQQAPASGTFDRLA